MASKTSGRKFRFGRAGVDPGAGYPAKMRRTVSTPTPNCFATARRFCRTPRPDDTALHCLAECGESIESMYA